MQVKITPALIAAAALLPSALANLQCSMQSFKANIINVEVESASDFSNKVHENKDWADVSLTGELDTLPVILRGIFFLTS